MTMRFDTKYEIGDMGAVYEYKVKFGTQLVGLNVSDDQLQHETELAVEDFAAMLRKRYKWVGEVYLTGRSGGWLAIEDYTGKATERSLSTIDGLVDQAKKQFIKDLWSSYGEAE